MARARRYDRIRVPPLQETNRWQSSVPVRLLSDLRTPSTAGRAAGSTSCTAPDCSTWTKTWRCLDLRTATNKTHRAFRTTRLERAAFVARTRTWREITKLYYAANLNLHKLTQFWPVQAKLLDFFINNSRVTRRKYNFSKSKVISSKNCASTGWIWAKFATHRFIRQLDKFMEWTAIIWRFYFNFFHNRFKVLK